MSPSEEGERVILSHDILLRTMSTVVHIEFIRIDGWGSSNKKVIVETQAPWKEANDDEFPGRYGIN